MPNENEYPGEKLVNVEFLRNVSVRGKGYDLGKTGYIPEGDAKTLIRMEKARLIPGEKIAPAPAVTPEPESEVAKPDPATLSDDEKIDLIVDAILGLDPDDEKLFTNSGEPDATILTGIVGFQVTKKLRKAALDAIEAADKEEDQAPEETATGGDAA